MEPYKFEQDIKKKLEKRRIQPSTNSWNKLADSLQFKEHKKDTKFLWLMGIAASIVGVLFVVSIFLNEEKGNSAPTIVNVPPPEKEDASIEVASEEIVIDEEILINNDSDTSNNNKFNNSSKKFNNKPIKKQEK